MKGSRQIHKYVKRTWCIVLSIIMLMTCFTFTALADEKNEEKSYEKSNNVIRVGSFEGVYNVVNEEGERSGYGYEYLQNIAGYAGWSYEYVDSTWEDCFEDMEKGKIDVLGGISYTKERARDMLFSDMPMGEERYYIYTSETNDKLSAANPSSFDGKSIGVLKDHIPEELLNVWEEKNDIEMKHINVSSTEEIMDKMEKHKIDCFVSVESAIWEEFAVSPVTSIGESNIYFAINKDRTDVKEAIDSAMRRIKDDNPFYTDDLYRRYLSTQSSPLLSKEEKDWLAEHGAIKIGYLNGDAGVSVLDSETGNLTGVITDYVEMAKNSLQGQNLEFELRGYDTRSQQLEALHEGEIDLIFHVSQNPYSAEKNGFVLSDTIWSFYIAAITTKNSFDENDENVVAVSNDNFALRAYISYNYPKWKIKEYKTNDDAVKAMENGEADCFLCNSGAVYEFIKDKKHHSFFLTKTADASFAVRQGEPLLLSIMNKTLMTVPSSKISGAVVSYSNAARKTTAADFIRDNVFIVIVLILLIFAAICGLWHRSIRNGKKAEKLNEVLKQQKVQIENALKEAKGQSEIIGSISKIYSFIYRIDVRDGTYEEVSLNSNIQNIAGAQGNFDEAKEDVIHAMVAEEYRQIISEFIDLPNLPKRLQDMDTVSIEYRTPQNTWQMAQIIVKNRDENHQVTEILYTVREIDKQKQLENQYKQELLFNSRVLSGISTDYTIAIIVNLDTDDYEIAFNQSTNHAKEEEHITTFTEYVDNYVAKFVLPEFKQSMRQTLNSQTIRKRFATEDDYHFSFETMPNAAGLSCFQVHIVKEYDEGGHFAFLGFRSVDEAIKQEREYKQKLQNQLDLISSSLPGGVKISNDDPTYSFKYVSEQFATMLGYDSPEELKSACDGSIVGLAHPADLNSSIADALDQYSRADHYATTYRVRCKDGSYKYIEDRGRKIIAQDGTVEHWNLILDKNDLMEKTIELESAKKASKSKSDFLARMSHDMRTPLNGIIGLIKINLDHFDDIELAKENYRKMQVSADHLLSLINDVLQMSKIEDGTVSLTHEPVDFNELGADISAIVEQRAAEMKIDLKFENLKDEMFCKYVYASPLHLRLIFINLYSNCIKYNHEGGSITTISDYELDEQGRCVYKWIISDTGIGMSKEFLEHIFEPFVQERNDARSVYQGTGLGMPIVKGLVEKMGGTIAVESEEDVGSTFTVRIPFEPVTDYEKLAVEEESEASIKGMRLLLAEDNLLNAEIAQTVLEDIGAVITMAHDGKQAVDIFVNSDKGDFDAILMDIMMPVMNGYEATKAIRSLDRPDAQTIPIIAMTANAFAEDAEKCLEAGMNAHLSKPLELEKMEKTLCEQVRLSKRNLS